MAYRVDRTTARNILAQCGAPLDSDFHTLGRGVVCALLDSADLLGYRKPRNANGSRGRYFHAYLVRAAQQPPRGMEGA